MRPENSAEGVLFPFEITPGRPGVIVQITASVILSLFSICLTRLENLRPCFCPGSSVWADILKSLCYIKLFAVGTMFFSRVQEL